MNPKRYCNCPEMQYWTEGGTHRIPILEMNGARHSCSYARQRSALVERAEAIAHKEVPDESKPYEWTRAFADAMEKLAAPLLAGRA